MLITLRNAFQFLSFAMAIVLFPAGSVFGQFNNQFNAEGTVKVNGGGTANTIRFSIDGADLLVVRDGNESRYAIADVDELEVTTFGGDDTVINDTHFNMMVTAGPGDDYLVGGSGDDELLGEGGDDSLFGRDGQDELDGGAGTDFLSGGSGDDLMFSSFLTDDMFGGPGDDRIFGGSGNGLSGDVTLSGGPGNDEIQFSNSSADTNVIGGPGADLINGDLAELGVLLGGNGQLFASGGPNDDTVSVTLESGMLVVRIENSTTAIEETYDPVDVDTVWLRGFAGDDLLVNASERWGCPIDC